MESNEYKRIIVTGGAGFIGSNFIKYLLNRYKRYTIICVDNLTYAGNKKTIEDLEYNNNFIFYKSDIRKRKEIFKIFDRERPDIVVNFAAESHVDRSIKKADEFISTNIGGTLVLLDACLYYSVKRFHQVSTDEVYGDLRRKNKKLFDEESKLEPSNPYAASKASADLLVKSYVRTHGLSASISRCSNNYGPYQNIEKLIPKTITNLVKGDKISIYGDGEHIRDWIYVLDHCEGIDLIIHNPSKSKVYNISANYELSNIKIVHKICQVLGIKEDRIEFVDDRKGHDFRYGVNSERIKTELGWMNKVEFEVGIKSTIKWYLNNKEWWQGNCKESI